MAPAAARARAFNGIARHGLAPLVVALLLLAAVRHCAATHFRYGSVSWRKVAPATVRVGAISLMAMESLNRQGCSCTCWLHARCPQPQRAIGEAQCMAQLQLQQWAAAAAANRRSVGWVQTVLLQPIMLRQWQCATSEFWPLRHGLMQLLRSPPAAAPAHRPPQARQYSKSTRQVQTPTPHTPGVPLCLAGRVHHLRGMEVSAAVIGGGGESERGCSHSSFLHAACTVACCACCYKAPYAPCTCISRLT